MTGSATPVARQNQLKNNMSFIESFAEVVEEEKQEDDDKPINLRGRQCRFKMMQDKNEFNKKSKRNRSTDFLKEKNIKYSNCNNQIGNVSEDDEELISDSSLEK